MKILLFGAGKIGRKYLDYVKVTTDATVIAFVDNDLSAKGKSIDGIEIIHANDMGNLIFDKIIISAQKDYAAEIFNQLNEMGVPVSKIEMIDANDIFWYYYHDYNETEPRVRWLKDFARNFVYKNNLSGNVAECGVYRGHFAKYINQYFPDKMLYLFDTFAGFDARDLDLERSFGNDFFNTSIFSLDENVFKGTAVEHVIQRMPNPEKCIVKKGYFPETAASLTDSFCFVNLDMDLFQPTLAALHIFWEKMERGGVILLHDYHRKDLPGVAQAVVDFELSINKYICKIPIGDFGSVALLKD